MLKGKLGRGGGSEFAGGGVGKPAPHLWGTHTIHRKCAACLWVVQGKRAAFLWLHHVQHTSQKGPCSNLKNIGSDGRLYCRNLIFVDYHLSDSQISLAVCVRLCGIEDVSCILCFFCRKF